MVWVLLNWSQLLSPTARCPAMWPGLWWCGTDGLVLRSLHHTDSAQVLGDEDVAVILA